MPAMPPQRTWFITGVSTGFGRALAEAALDRGDNVAGTLRRPDQLEPFNALQPDRALALLADVTDTPAVYRAVDATIAAFGRVDVLVNNAGYGLQGAIEELDDAASRAQFDVNVFGLLEVTRAVLPHMRRQRAGHIVQLSSMAGVLGRAGLGLYAASKHAVEGLSQSLAAETAPFGVRVTVVEPGAFRTEWAGRSMVHAEAIADYDETVRPTRERLSRLNGKQAGDPARLAAAIIAVVDADDPPFRLPLGGDAVDMIRAALDRQRAEIDAWEDLSRDVEFDDAAGTER
jgi:NAD(P)-dependent dehydrogenase (short-subunit alcohol dehydrogenase family)